MEVLLLFLEMYWIVSGRELRLIRLQVYDDAVQVYCSSCVFCDGFGAGLEWRFHKLSMVFFF